MPAHEVQSTTVYVPSSELGLSYPSPASECAPPNQRKDGTLACGKGVGGVPIPTTGEKSLALCLLCVPASLHRLEPCALCILCIVWAVLAE